MFLLALCLVAAVTAMPAIPEAPSLPDDVIITNPQVLMAYSNMGSPALYPLKSLEMRIEPIPEPEKEYVEPSEEPQEIADKAQESMSEEPAAEASSEPPVEASSEPAPASSSEAPKPVVVNLDIPKRPSFLSNFFSFLPAFSLPNFNLPPIISNLFNTKDKNPRMLYPGYAVIIDEAKP